MLEPYLVRTSKINKRDLSQITQKLYIAFIKNFYKKHLQKNLEDNHSIIRAIKNEEFDNEEIKDTFEFLNKNFYDIIKNESEGTIRNLGYIFSRTTYDDLVCKILPYTIMYADNYRNRRKDTKNDFKIDFDNEIELINLIKEAHLQKKMNLQEVILLSLLLFNPPKRLQEYQYCKIVKEKPTKEMDKKWNYLYEDTMYINICKNDRRNKKEKDENDFKNISKLNMKYTQPFLNVFVFDYEERERNDFLLNEYVPDNKISKILSSATMKVFERNIGIHELRRLYLTYKDEKGMRRTEREEIAKFMNHNLQEQNNYIYADT